MKDGGGFCCHKKVNIHLDGVLAQTRFEVWVGWAMEGGGFSKNQVVPYF